MGNAQRRPKGPPDKGSFATVVPSGCVTLAPSPVSSRRPAERLNHLATCGLFPLVWLEAQKLRVRFPGGQLFLLLVVEFRARSPKRVLGAAVIMSDGAAPLGVYCVQFGQHDHEPAVGRIRRRERQLSERRASDVEHEPRPKTSGSTVL